MTHKPELFSYTKRSAYEIAKTGQPRTFAQTGKESLANSSAHWESVNKSEIQANLKHEPIKSTRPVWSLPREAYTSKRAYHETEYSNSLGKYGHNPRNVLPGDATKQSN